jgi:biopolymer transport protein ExbB/TolQ
LHGSRREVIRLRQRSLSLLPALSIPSAVLTYALLYRRGEGDPAYEFFCNRGYYQHAIVFLFWLGTWMLVVHLLVHLNELRALRLEMPSLRMSPEQAASLTRNIPEEYQRSLVGRRVAALWRGYGRKEDVGPLVDRLARSDRDQVEHRYATVSWVRTLPPIIGLLGTLDGLRHGAFDLAQMSGGGDLSAIRSALRGFALSSSTAFDTTLLGLVCSLILSVLIFSLEQQEKRLLAALDEMAGEMARLFLKTPALESVLGGVIKDAVQQFAAQLNQAQTRLLDGLAALSRGERSKTP